MLEYSYFNPFRPPDWRWLRATGINNRTQLSTTRKRDAAPGYMWIRRAVRFQVEYDRARNDQVARSELAGNRPALYWAHHLHTQEPTMKAAVQAYILARQNDFEVGYRCGLAPEIVEAYEAIFFNVREKLNHSEYILHCVIGPDLQQALSERLYALLWKLYGYFCGPHFLAALTSKFPNAVWCQTADAMSAAIQDDAIATLKLKAAIAAKTVSVGQNNQLALMEQFTKFVEVERSTESQGRAQDQILGHIQALFAALPFQVGAPQNGMDSNPLDTYDQSSIELTFQETMRVTTRQPLRDAELLKNLQFPQTVLTQKDLEAEKLSESSS
jgi:hypothetical protein